MPRTRAWRALLPLAAIPSTACATVDFDYSKTASTAEVGIILDEPELARGLAETVGANLPTHTFRLGTDERGALLWFSQEDGEEVVYYSEPGAGCLRKLAVGLMGLLPIKGQL